MTKVRDLIHNYQTPFLWFLLNHARWRNAGLKRCNMQQVRSMYFKMSFKGCNKYGWTKVKQ